MENTRRGGEKDRGQKGKAIGRQREKTRRMLEDDNAETIRRIEGDKKAIRRVEGYKKAKIRQEEGIRRQEYEERWR